MIYERVHPEFMCFWLVKHFFLCSLSGVEVEQTAAQPPLTPATSRGTNRSRSFATFSPPPAPKREFITPLKRLIFVSNEHT